MKSELTSQDLAERERLVTWMNENGYRETTLAAATGDFYNNIKAMLKGDRRVSQAFKWRFEDAFGNEEANKVFRPHLVTAETSTNAQREAEPA
jgi:hypothetical protein